eukprot:NODE_162_length_3485_cov_7.209946.p1 GENE.NODE_162_length_3485_cov_7.209946~~NODE_162_length_3485_cov_7.209946.p1  ORF type:complete len:915 (+),score=229.81 NODE_162_length_3485_cov_7.209946:642-3386(+)
MDKIGAACPHFIRCVKPNTAKVPKTFEGKMVLEQLLNSGVLMTVIIRQKGFAYRVPHAVFVARFRCIVEFHKSKPKLERVSQLSLEKAKQECVRMLDDMMEVLPGLAKFGAGTFALGKTKVFMKTNAVQALEDSRRLVLQDICVYIQRVMRGAAVRRANLAMLKTHIKILALLSRISKRSRLSTLSLSIEELLNSTPRDSRNSRRSSTRKSRSECPWTSAAILSKLSEEEARDAVEKMQDGLDEAEGQGLVNATVSELRRVWRRLQQEVEVTDELHASAKSVDPGELERITTRFAGLSLPATPASEAIGHRLGVLKVQLPVRKALADGLRASDDFEAACQQGKSEAGAGIGGLRQAIEDAAMQGTSAELAKKRLLEEESGAAARAAAAKMESSARRTVAFVAQRTEDDLLLGLQTAARELDSDALQALLGQAVECGLNETEDVLVKARAIFNELQVESFVFRSLQESRDAADGDAATNVDLKRLANLLKLLERLPGYEEECQRAQQSLQHGLAKRSQAAGRKSIFRSGDPEELQLATGAFHRLANFSRLKLERNWAGHHNAPQRGGNARFTRRTVMRNTVKRRTTMRRTMRHQDGEDGGSNEMLAFNKEIIVEALTVPKGRAEEEYEAAATINFRNLLVCMGDWPAQTCQRKASEDAVVALLMTDDIMADEVYVQVMKQLTNNSTLRSTHLGWQLLHRLCQQAPPTGELAEFVRCFLRDAAQPDPEDEVAEADGSDEPANPGHGSPWVVSIAESCLAALDQDGEKPSSNNCQLSAEINRITGENARLVTEIQRLHAARAGPTGSAQIECPRVKVHAETARQIQEKLVDIVNKKSAQIKELKACVMTQTAKGEVLLGNQQSQAEEMRRFTEELTRLRIRSQMLEEAIRVKAKAGTTAAGIAKAPVAATEDMCEKY